jgi:hypothetical protein
LTSTSDLPIEILDVEKVCLPFLAEEETLASIEISSKS